MTVSVIPTEDFSFDPEEVPEFLAAAERNEKNYKKTDKYPEADARLASLSFKKIRRKHAIAGVSTNPALVMVIVKLQGPEECLIAFDIRTCRLRKKAIHFTDSPAEWEPDMCYLEPDILASLFE